MILFVKLSDTILGRYKSQYFPARKINVMALSVHSITKIQLSVAVKISLCSGRGANVDVSYDKPVSRFEFAADRPCNYVSDLATGQSARCVIVGTRT